MNIAEKLSAMQRELLAPKTQFNSFGKYSYRSCEDILEALKPILAKFDAVLTISDDLVLVGSWVFVKAIATLKVGGEEFTVSAFARLDESKKGMDSAQLTGSASSYARKYALNGLFLIDDEHDGDAQEPPAPQTLGNGYGNQPAAPPPPPPRTPTATTVPLASPYPPPPPPPPPPPKIA